MYHHPFKNLLATQLGAALITTAMLFTVGVPDASAQGQSRGVSKLIPQIEEISLNDAGQLVASGNILFQQYRGRGGTVVSEFSNVPVNLSLSEDQSGADSAGCPILDLELGPIEVDLLGLVVETSPICLRITAYEGGGLLGDLLCEVANLLDGGLSLNEILEDLLDDLVGSGSTASLLSGLEDLLNEALGALSEAVVTSAEITTAETTCGILHLELGPVDLTLLGLEVILDDCAGGPVVVDITGETGQLLGDLLCDLLGGSIIDVGSTLQDILDAIRDALAI